MAGKLATHQEIADLAGIEVDYLYKGNKMIVTEEYSNCLLYTSDAADD